MPRRTLQQPLQRRLFPGVLFLSARFFSRKLLHLYWTSATTPRLYLARARAIAKLQGMEYQSCATVKRWAFQCPWRRRRTPRWQSRADLDLSCPKCTREQGTGCLGKGRSHVCCLQDCRTGKCDELLLPLLTKDVKNVRCLVQQRLWQSAHPPLLRVKSQAPRTTSSLSPSA